MLPLWRTVGTFFNVDACRWRVSNESPSSKHLDGSSGSPSCLWTVPPVWSHLSFVVLDPRLEKQPRLWEQAARKPRGGFRGFWVNYSHATHVAASPREAEGSSPAGQVTRSSQGLTTTIWTHLPCSPPLQVSMASTWRPAISDITSTRHQTHRDTLSLSWCNAHTHHTA